MAHKLDCHRKKCVKSTNCFRDRQEYSSLYTISSHSASSIHSSDMASQTTRRSNYQNRMFMNGENYNGDSETANRNIQPQQTYNSPCKTPNCTCDMRNEMHHSNVCPCGYHDFCNERMQYINPPSLDTCEYVRQCCGNKPPRCPVHKCKPKYRSNLKNLEECYWAKWKPSKFDCTPRFTRGCFDCDCPNKQTTKKLAPKRQDTKKQDARQQETSSVEVLREPGVFESNSSDVNSMKQQSAKDLYDQVLNEYQNHYSEENVTAEQGQKPIDEPNNREEQTYQEELKQPDDETPKGVRFTSLQKIAEYDPSFMYDTNLYNDMYDEYENEFMNRIEDDEEEKYQELYDDMYNEYENELISRIPSDQTGASTGTETERSEKYVAGVEGSVQVLHKPDSLAQNDDIKPTLTTLDEYSNIGDLSLTHADSSKQKMERSRESQPRFPKLSKHITISDPPLKGHTYPLKSVVKKERERSKTGYGRSASPMKGSKNYMPAYLQRIVSNK